MFTDEYRAVFEAAPDGILVVDHRGLIHSVNPMVGRLFGYASEELVGENVDALVPQAARSAHADHRARYVRTPHARPMGVAMDLRGRRKDGTEFPVEISLSPWESPEGLRVIVSVRDVTQRKRLRDFGAGALRASEEERQRIARELHDDTAQRLASLLMWVRLIEPDVQENGRARLHDLRNEIAACAEGVRRIARGLRPPELEDAGLVAALRAHVRTIREGTGMNVEIDADPVDDLLDPDARLALYRIVQEAISNAIRHSGADTVRVQLHLDAGKVVGVVRDEGKGFGPSAETRDGGGLGLVSMQERATMVGGRLSIESQPGQGSTVRVELPVIDRRRS